METTIQDLGDTAKAALRPKFIAINYIMKKERLQITSHQNELGKTN